LKTALHVHTSIQSHGCYVMICKEYIKDSWMKTWAQASKLSDEQLGITRLLRLFYTVKSYSNEMPGSPSLMEHIVVTSVWCWEWVFNCVCQLSFIVCGCSVVCVADKVIQTLGEGTFGKVVECADLSRYTSASVTVSVSVSASVHQLHWCFAVMPLPLL